MVERIFLEKPILLSNKKGQVTKYNEEFYDKWKLYWMLMALNPVICGYKTPLNTVGVLMRLHKYQINPEPKAINTVVFEAIKDVEDKLLITFYHRFSGNKFNSNQKNTYEIILEKISDMDNYFTDVETQLGLILPPKYKRLITGKG